jgi:hypothetical protein
MDPHGRIGPYRAYGVGYSAGRHLPILEHNERIVHLVVMSSSYRDDGPDTVPERVGLEEGIARMIEWCDATFSGHAA